MKTVMKKLLSLALVAILLVSAVPFQASASETETKSVKIDVDVYVNDKFEVTKQNRITVTEGTDVTLNEELAKTVVDNWQYRTFDKWEDNAGNGGTLYYSWLSVDANRSGYKLKLYIKENKPAHVHSYTETITTAATCTEKGLKTLTCANTDGQCDVKTKTEEIPATGHSWGDWSENGGYSVRTCKNGCGTTESKTIVKFVADGETVKKMYLNEGDVIGTLPTAPKKVGYDENVLWYTGLNGTGTQLLSTSAWDGKTTTYYAKYVENPDGTKDGLSYLYIRMKLYTGSTQTNDVLLEKVVLEDNTNILTWLNQNEERVSDAIFGQVSATKYEWVDRVYYNNDTEAELTSQATLADGDKTVFVKVHAIASTETNVQLYIHQYNSTSKSYSTLKIVDVGGYKAGDTITLTKMATVVKKYYSYKTITGLYTDTTWKQMVNGQNPTASTSITVSDGTTVKYHVILRNASTVSSSTADTTNPKTGDMIFVPMMVMLASAAAVAFVYMGSKKRTAR